MAMAIAFGNWKTTVRATLAPHSWQLPTHNPPTGSEEGPPSSPTVLSPSSMDLPLLDIPLQPRFDRCLSASIHAPANAPQADISPPPAPPSTRVPTPLATPPLLIPLPPSPPVPISPTAPPPGHPKKRYNHCPTPPFPPVSVTLVPSGSDLVPARPSTDQTPTSPLCRCSGRERRAPDRYGVELLLMVE
ncbi:hypothetical protein PCASD_18481 [Puccinia coronata f. sp. avenae]|uniref:Uncharacterized protein n=1 Tax=Puccinia coronata f. sp. avenae TaxID=200324 RepID=A0A2N5STX2_9BASI|nr:hypothetical protein PCASD_18481 [Puccinia coronata f. sp. avenae]